MQVCGLLQVFCDANTGRVSEIEIASPDNIMDHYPELRNVMRDRSAASCCWRWCVVQSEWSHLGHVLLLC